MCLGRILVVLGNSTKRAGIKVETPIQDNKLLNINFTPSKTPTNSSNKDKTTTNSSNKEKTTTNSLNKKSNASNGKKSLNSKIPAQPKKSPPSQSSKTLSLKKFNSRSEKKPKNPTNRKTEKNRVTKKKLITNNKKTNENKSVSKEKLSRSAKDKKTKTGRSIKPIKSLKSKKKVSEEKSLKPISPIKAKNNNELKLNSVNLTYKIEAYPNGKFHIFNIINIKSNKCLGVYGAEPGDNLFLYSCQPKYKTQQWIVI